MQSTSILIIDSGVGGLSVAKNIRLMLPNQHIVYIADQAEYPYGQKSDEEITQRVLHIVDRSIQSFQPQLAVIACNTASTLVLTHLRSRFNIPFIGVVPAIKPAVKLSNTGIIGILATQGTINRNYTANLVSEFAKGKEVHLYGSSALVNLAENKLKGMAIDESILTNEVKKLTDKSLKMDTIVLACTHFPILRDELSKNFPNIINWVDSGEAIARRTMDLLNQTNSVSATTINQENHFYTTASLSQYSINQLIEFLGHTLVNSITL